MRDFAALGAEWEALEARAEATVFQGWGWVGCLAEERYGDPLLLRAEAGGRLLGLALFNRRRGALHLAEAGDPERDRPFIEHNAPLVAREAPPGTAALLLRAAWRLARPARLVLGGVAPGLARAAGGVAWRWETRPAPFLDLAAIRGAGGDWTARLSANARQQLRRSDRRFAARGPLAVRAAGTPGEAEAFLEELMAWHTRRWAARGEAGAFATPWLRRFHHALVQRCLARGELELLRVTAGATLVGLLYNLRRGGRVHAYQSGFPEPGAEPALKPAWTCHHLAIRRALARGDREYDFLAGEQRHKRSLARESRDLVWAELVPRASPRGLLAPARPWLSALKARLAGG